MLKKVFRPNETREYKVILERSVKGNYVVSHLKDGDTRLVKNYIDGLMSDSELIPAGEDKVCVNLTETDKTLFCEVKPFSTN